MHHFTIRSSLRPDTKIEKFEHENEIVKANELATFV
jgi:hypothetical protein